MMDFRHDGFDVWVFRGWGAAARYLVLRASPHKARTWFGGSQFWQVPSHFVGARTPVAAITDELRPLGLAARSVWAAEHADAIYNRRYEDVVHLSVFAAEVESDDVALGAGHDGYRWVSAEEAAELVTFRGLREGLQWVRHHVTERSPAAPELRLA